MSTDYIPYGRQHITEADIQSIEAVLRSPWLTQGPVVPKFEHAVATNVGARYAVAVNSATSALHVACLALGLGPGDRLWTTPITFVASANCARYCGAEIDFVDIDPASGLISVVALERKLESAALAGLLPKVIVPVHLSGSSCAMAPISALARRYGIAVLEDASHAIGGHYKEEPVGNCRYSDITVFSFHPVKIITTGEGGLATTNDETLARRMADLRSHGIVKEQSRFQLTPAGDWSYEQQELGFNYRMTDIQAALGLSQLQRLETIVKERRELLSEYDRMMTGLPLRMLEVEIDVQTAGHLAIIRLDNTCPEHHRAIFSGLRASQIGVQVHYTPVHLQPYYRGLGFRESDFPAAEAYATNAISLPIYPGLLKKHQEKVVSCLSSLLCYGSRNLRG